MMKVIEGKHAPTRLDTFFGLSDDPKHDPVFVEHHLDQMIKIFDLQRAQDGRCEMDWLSIVTDGGPGHYKQRKNFFKTSKFPWKFKRSGNKALDIDWSFFAEHHGKCILDAFTAVLKSSWNRFKLNSKVENVSQKGILLHNAKTCLEWSEKYIFLQCKKAEGQEDIPSVTRKRCCHVVEQAN